MILGIGSDLIDIKRVEKTLERYDVRFMNRLFTEEELATASRREARAATLAKRFAAKEACAKALGTGINKGVYFRDMGVTNLSSGQPSMRLTGGAKKQLDKITPPGMNSIIHLSLSDDHPFAQAFVIIEAIPA